MAGNLSAGARTKISRKLVEALVRCNSDDFDERDADIISNVLAVSQELCAPATQLKFEISVDESLRAHVTVTRGFDELDAATVRKIARISSNVVAVEVDPMHERIRPTFVVGLYCTKTKPSASGPLSGDSYHAAAQRTNTRALDYEPLGISDAQDRATIDALVNEVYNAHVLAPAIAVHIDVVSHPAATCDDDTVTDDDEATERPPRVGEESRVGYVIAFAGVRRAGGAFLLHLLDAYPGIVTQARLLPKGRLFIHVARTGEVSTSDATIRRAICAKRSRLDGRRQLTVDDDDSSVSGPAKRRRGH